jgi:hypothetical protein
VTKFTNLTPLSLLISCKLLLPTVDLKMSYFPTLALKSPKNVHILFKVFIEHTFQFLVEAVLYIISFILCCSMNVQNNDMTPATS